MKKLLSLFLIFSGIFIALFTVDVKANTYTVSTDIVLTEQPQVVADVPLEELKLSGNLRDNIMSRGVSFENVRVKVLLSYDKNNGLEVYTELYSSGASPKFSSMSGTTTVTGPSYRKSFSLSQRTTATRTIAKYVSTGKKFKSGSRVTARSKGRAYGGNVIGGSGSFDIKAEAKVP